MNNIFLFDIDGTLSVKGIIPASAKEIIKRVRKNGDLVILATGRCEFQLNSIKNEIEYDGAIMNNGGYIVVNNQIISKHPISKCAIKRLIAMGYFVTYLNNHFYARVDEHKIYKEFADYFHVPEAQLMPEEILNEEMYSLGVYTYHPEKLDESLFPELEFVQVAPLGFDVIAKGVSKGSGIEDLRKIYKDYGIIAFGDNYNDLEMIQNADISIVMPKSPSELKAIASFVTKDPLEDGIYYAIKEYLKYED